MTFISEQLKVNLLILRVTLFAFAITRATLASAFSPTEDGLFAVFDTTAGEFTAKLYYEKVPITVSNFVGLAENSISHFDEADGTAQNKKYYDGIIFHRVIADFVIQGGSPKGDGSDGPGYSFVDEIDTSLKHDKKGMLSMANAGPNSNGSQFFVTLSATTATGLDGLHAIFGEIVDGIEVVDAIGATATDANDKPINSITITSITIVREGSAAEAFNPTDVMRPFKVTIDPTFQASPSGMKISFPRDEFRDYFIYSANDLETISKPKRLLWPESNPEIIEHSVELPENGMGSVFYRYSELAFPWDDSKPGATFSFTLPTGYGTHTVTLGEEGLATFTSDNGPGECSYSWFDLGSRVQVYFFFPFQQWYEVQVHIEKGTLNSGTTLMRVNDPFFSSFTHNGAFTYTPAP